MIKRFLTALIALSLILSCMSALALSDTALEDYTLTLPRAGKLTLLLDTDWQCFGGKTEKPKRAAGKACDGTLKVTLAPFSGRLYKLV